jgi:uncharacterized LabA/DUF88 family protein
MPNPVPHGWNSNGSEGNLGAAVFVDFDNLYYGLLSELFQRDHKKTLEASENLLNILREELKGRRLSIVLGRSYSAFDEFPGSEVAHSLALMGFDPQYIVHHKGKNSADLQLSLDLMEVLLTRRDIDVFVIVGGDRDFIPVSRKVLEARRELLIAALPENTSGDLLDRVGSERFLDISALLEVPEEGTKSCSEVEGGLDEEEGSNKRENLDSFAQEEQGGACQADLGSRRDRVVSTSSTKSKRTSFHSKTQLKWEPLSDEEAFSRERKDKVLRFLFELAKRYEEKHGKAEVWLSPFLKNEMPEYFPDLTHPQRRRLINILKEEGKIEIEERENENGPFPYSVVLLNPEHPVVKDLLTA